MILSKVKKIELLRSMPEVLCSTVAPVVEHLAPSPAEIAAPAPMAEFFPTALAVIAVRASVMEFIIQLMQGRRHLRRWRSTSRQILP